MDRRFLLFVVLSLGILSLWYGVLQPKFFPRPPTPPPSAAPETRRTETQPAAAPRVAASRPAVDLELVKPVVLSNENLRLTFSTQGAALISAELKDYKRSPYGPEWLDLLKHYPDPTDPSAIRIPRALEIRDLSDGKAWLEFQTWRVEAADDLSVTFVCEPQGAPYRIRKRVAIPAKGNHAQLTLTLEYLAAGMVEKPLRMTVSGGVTLDADVYGTHDLTGAESLIFQDDPQEGEKLERAMPTELGKIEAKPPDEPQKALAFNGRRRFVADINNYFGVYCALEQMPDRMKAWFVGNVEPMPGGSQVTRTRVDLEFTMKAEPEKPAEHKMLLYFGPNEARFIEADLTGENAPWATEFSRIYGEALGAFAWIGRAVLFLLRTFESLTGNWGVAIMLLTFFVRLVLFPINRRSQIAMVRHSAGMARVKPKLDLIREKYKNDSRKLLAEQQALMKAEKVPLVPLGGCLPLLLQIPIFYGLFAALRASIELRQAKFLWALDLSQPDHLVWFTTPYPNPLASLCCCAPPGMSNTISGIHLLPLLMTAAWFVNQLLMPKPATEDPQMAQQRKMMMFLPILMGLMMYGYGAGLSLYWLTSSLIGIVESRIIKKSLPPPAGKAPVPVPAT